MNLNNELLNDLDNYDNHIKENLRLKKLKILEEETVSFEDNIYSDIKKIISNIPDNLSNIEKLRYIYINLGRLFNYDYRVAYDYNYVNKRIDLNSYIEQHATCIQITEILNNILNNIDGISSETIQRKIDNMRGAYGHDHVANKVKIKINDDIIETYLLDLTLDLYLIQSGCKTMHFGYENDINADYDIIPQIDNQEIDKKLKFNTLYMDNIINDIREKFNNQYNDITLINQKLLIINSLIKKNMGYHEGKQFINLLFLKLLNCNYKEYNILKKDEKDNIINFKTIFKIEYNDYIKWIIYSKKYGLIAIDEVILKQLFNNNWITRSTNLFNEINQSKLY